MLPLFAGFLAGSAHVISGPDHLAALAPIALDSPKNARTLGIRWGVGHGMGVLILGGIGVATQHSFDLNLISNWSEFFVGMILIGVGGWAFYRARGMIIHSHPHQHHDERVQNDPLSESSRQTSDSHTHHHEHSHIHIHTLDPHHDQAHQGHQHTAFWVGMLHGMAGGGHLFGVLPSLALPPMDAGIYLLSYFVSAVLSMAIFASFLGYISVHQGPLFLKRLMYGVSLSVVGIGCLWSYQSWPI